MTRNVYTGVDLRSEIQVWSKMWLFNKNNPVQYTLEWSAEWNSWTSKSQTTLIRISTKLYTSIDLNLLHMEDCGRYNANIVQENEPLN